MLIVSKMVLVVKTKRSVLAGRNKDDRRKKMKKTIKHAIAIALIVSFAALALGSMGSSPSGGSSYSGGSSSSSGGGGNNIEPTPFPELCNACNGRGGATCHGCFGSGTFDTGSGRVDCSYCGGTGWLKCRVCNGTGRKR